MIFSQRKYVFDFLQETMILGAKVVTLPMNSRIHLYDDQTKVVVSKACQSLIGNHSM